MRLGKIGFSLLLVLPGQPGAAARQPYAVEVPRRVQREAVRELQVRAAPFSAELRLRGRDTIDVAVTAVQFDMVRSRAIPHTTYYWAHFSPSGTYDMEFSVAIVDDGRIAKPIRTGADVVANIQWLRNGSGQGWQVRVVRLCEELVGLLSPRANGLDGVVPFRTGADLDGLPGPIRDQLEAAGLHPPFLYPTKKVTSVFLWALEPGQTTRYRCTPLDGNPSKVLVAVDSIAGVGRIIK